jgi:hypothetical protein
VPSELAIAEAVLNMPSAISLESYIHRMRRMDSGSDASIPAELLEEVFLLVYLLMEGKDDPLPKEYAALGREMVCPAAGYCQR